MKPNARLKRLYEERISGPGLMTQKEFGQRYGIGTQSMVAQYVNGDKTMGLEVVEKFARGLRCTIYDIDPELGDWLTSKVYPILGKALRRAAVIAGAALLFTAFDIKPAAAHLRVQATDFIHIVLRSLWHRFISLWDFRPAIRIS